MFMVIDLKKGGDMRFALSKSGGKFPEMTTRFMIAEISLGIITRQTLIPSTQKQRPFRGKHDEAVEEAIQNKELSIPKEPKVSEPCSDFIRGLLTRPYHERLGAKEMGGDTSIKGHRWFEKCDWIEIEKLKGTPLYVPDVSA
ncbi:hypothetical protein HDU98_010689 [Podochytrium sp. JEL0797]|nr:hypothetical protein HDU98_010689 [Podochytrium sp. JEL0797]